MREIDRYFNLVAQNKSSIRKKFKSATWFNNSYIAEDTYWFISLSQAGLGKLSEVWFSASVYFSLLIGFLFFFLFGMISGFSAFVIFNYFFLVRVLRFKSLSRRIAFNRGIKSFLKEFRFHLDNNLNFSKSLEAAKNSSSEEVFKKELSEVVSKNFNFQKALLNMSKKISGKEVKILASSLYILSNSKDVSRKGLDRLEEILIPICRGVSSRAEARKTLYIISIIVSLFLIVIDVFIYKNFAASSSSYLMEALVITQLFFLIICFDLADRSVGE